jgi:2-haloacid dehalogenase
VSDDPPIAVVFDVGNVLVQWDVRALYRKMFDNEEAMERFLADVWTADHNLRCDSGELFADVTAEVIAQHPEFTEQIRAADERWDETIPGPVEGSFELLSELHDAGVPLYGITNFSHETFPRILTRYPQLGLMAEIVVSGQVGVTKPDRRIFETLCERTGLNPDRAIFVDDSPVNTAGAAAAGFDTITFTDALSLRQQLAKRGVPISPTID